MHLFGIEASSLDYSYGIGRACLLHIEETTASLRLSRQADMIPCTLEAIAKLQNCKTESLS